MVGPLPPPVAGMAVVVQSLSAALQTHCRIRVLDNAKSTAPDRTFARAVMTHLRLLLGFAWAVLCWRPHLIHVHTCSGSTFWRNGLDVVLARLLMRRVILHVHGGRFGEFLSTLGGLQGWCARGIFRLCDRVLVLGPAWVSVLAPWCGSTRVVVVPNGVAVPETAHGRPADGCEILCISNYEPGKGQEDLIDAFARLGGKEEARLTLVGAELESGRAAALRRRADELGLGDRISVPGPAYGEAKDAYFRAAALFCLPSRAEGLPMVLLEAMAQGLPVVCTRVGSIPEVVRDGEDGYLVPPGDVDGLSERLCQLLGAPDDRARMGQVCRERLQEKFTLERCVERLLEIYAGVVPSPSGSVWSANRH